MQLSISTTSERVDVQRAQELLRSLSVDDEGSFYGSPKGLSLGAGLLYDGVTFPLFDQKTGRFKAQSGLICVLSHECDVDPANDRFLNGMVLISMVLPLAAVVEEATDSEFPDDAFGAFLGHVARRRTPRCVYFPLHPEFLPDGGILNLNLLASTNRTEFAHARCVAALSAQAYRSVTMALEQHLTRPKAEILPFTDASVGRGRSIHSKESSTTLKAGGSDTPAPRSPSGNRPGP